MVVSIITKIDNLSHNNAFFKNNVLFKLTYSISNKLNKNHISDTDIVRVNDIYYGYNISLILNNTNFKIGFIMFTLFVVILTIYNLKRLISLKSEIIK